MGLRLNNGEYNDETAIIKISGLNTTLTKIQLNDLVNYVKNGKIENPFIIPQTRFYNRPNEETVYIRDTTVEIQSDINNLKRVILPNEQNEYILTKPYNVDIKSKTAKPRREAAYWR